jgi:hypothetical protein
LVDDLRLTGEGRIQIPNHKHQIQKSTKFQIPMFKTKMLLLSSLRFDHGVIGNWNLFGIWSLVLGIFLTFVFLAGPPERQAPPM